MQVEFAWDSKTHQLLMPSSGEWQPNPWGSMSRFTDLYSCSFPDTPDTNLQQTKVPELMGVDVLEVYFLAKSTWDILMGIVIEEGEKTGANLLFLWLKEKSKVADPTKAQHFSNCFGAGQERGDILLDTSKFQRNCPSSCSVFMVCIFISVKTLIETEY